MANAIAAAHALDSYAAKRGQSHQYASTQVMVTDLITDLLHLLDERKAPPHNAQPMVAHSIAAERFGAAASSR